MSGTDYREKYSKDSAVNNRATAIVKEFDETKPNEKESELKGIVGEATYGQYSSRLTYAYEQAAIEIATPKDPKAPTKDNEMAYNIIKEKMATPQGLMKPAAELSKKLFEQNVEYVVDSAVNRFKENGNVIDAQLKHLMGTNNQIIQKNDEVPTTASLVKNFNENNSDALGTNASLGNMIQLDKTGASGVFSKVKATVQKM